MSAEPGLTASIVRRGGRHVIVYRLEGKTLEESCSSRDEAIARIEQLGRELKERMRRRRERSASDPETQKRRARKRAYRVAERDPMLKVLKNVLPRTGSIAKATEESWQRVLGWLDGHLVATSSDERVRRALSRTPGQRRTEKAATARATHGAASVAKVLSLWRSKPLASTPQRKRASRVAAMVHLDVSRVRTILRTHLGKRVNRRTR